MDGPKAEWVRGWLTKASRDLSAARLLSAADDAMLDLAIFHCQQASEKALKGFLAAQDLRPEKTHNVGHLIDQAAPFEPALADFKEAGERLTSYASDPRYPGLKAPPSREEFDRALIDAETIYRRVLALLPPEVDPAA